MATKLKDLKVTKVDFVDVGANQDAHIMLYKRADDKPVSEQPEEPEPKESALKRFLSAIGKALSIEQADIDSATEEIEKSISTPTEDAESAASEPDISTNGGVEDTVSKKGETKMEGINTELMTPAERAFFEEIVKRYSVNDSEVEKSEAKKTDDNASEAEKCDTKKSATPENSDDVQKAAPAQQNDDPYASLHPAVAAELKELKKRAEVAEEKELLEVAKKYEIIGKKAEELAPVLKSLKAAGGSAYDDMIGVLDASVEAVNKSGMFDEIGKSGSFGAADDAWQKIEKKAEEIMEKDASLTHAQAVDKACQMNPTLVHEYERGM